MRYFKFVILTCCITVFNVFYSQGDSITVKEKEDVKFLFTLDARGSRVFDQKVSFYGIKMGLNYQDKNRFGIGLYGLKQPIQQINTPVDYLKYPDATDTNQVDFNYFSFFYERVWLKNKRWELTTPIHLGLGGLVASYKDTSGNFVPYLRGGSWLVEVSGVAQYKVFRWFAIGAGFGQRWLLTRDKPAKKVINGPVTILQFKLLLGELFKMTFQRDKLEEW